MANRIMLNETSYHGAGAIQEIATEAKARAFQKAFVCSDPDLIKFGVTAKVTDVLEKAGLAYEIYSDIKANPTIQNVQNGVAAFKKAEADYIIAIGGGSSMDTAKAAVEAVQKLSVDVGIPTKLEALKEEDLQFMAESAYADACCPGNPKDTCVEDLKDLFRKLM